MSSQKKTIIHVIGGGSIGLLFAGRLSPFAQVHIISRSGNTIGAHFQIESIDGHINKYELESEACAHATIDWLFVCTKSYDTEQAVNLVVTRFAKKTKIVLFGNGMGYQQRIAASHPETKLFVASTTEGANRPPKDVCTTAELISVKHAGKGKTIIGAFPCSEPGMIDPDLHTLSDLLNKGGFKNEITDNIFTALWRKLIVNCGINPFTAILQCTNGEILTNAQFTSRIDNLCDELSDVAKISGVNISAKECKASIIAVAKATQHNRSSMLQDVTRSRPTEIDYMNGFVCQQGDQSGKNYSTNRELTIKVLQITRPTLKN
jgi:2-dehydropantoate 2-reductase